MSRVCIIGNSHLGAFKLALDAGNMPDISDRYEFDTFGSIRASILQTRIVGQRLVPTRKDVTENFERTSGGQSEIDLSQYSAFVIAIRNSPFWIRPFLADTQIMPVSRAMVAAIHRNFMDDWSIDLSVRIAEVVPKARVFFVGRPLNTQKDKVARKLLRQFDGPDKHSQVAMKDTVLQYLADAVASQPVAPNVDLVRPPDHLLEPHRLFTLAKYARGAQDADTGLKQVFKDDDTMHMNGAYGREMLMHMLAPL